MIDFKFSSKQFSSLTKQLDRRLKGRERKNFLNQIGQIIENDIGENIDKGQMFDGGKMPFLADSTIKRKAAAGKNKKLRWNGALRKLDHKAGKDSVTVWSEGHTSKANYADILNEYGGGPKKYRYNFGKKEPKQPFRFAGYGDKLMKKINKEILYWINKIK